VTRVLVVGLVWLVVATALAVGLGKFIARADAHTRELFREVQRHRQAGLDDEVARLRRSGL